MSKRENLSAAGIASSSEYREVIWEISYFSVTEVQCRCNAGR